MNETRAYIKRGRRLQRSSNEVVLAAWVATFETWYKQRSIENAVANDDAAAELRLRGLEPPYKQVGAEIHALRADIECQGDTPPEELVQRIRDFLAALRGSKN
jgi:hypothetical protein